MSELTGAISALAGAVRDATPDCTVDASWRWRQPRAAELGLRFCRGLAERLRPVPAEHLHGDYVRCVCGHGVRRRELWTWCAGGCGRVFIADESGVWAARLPEQEEVPDAA